MLVRLPILYIHRESNIREMIITCQSIYHFDKSMELRILVKGLLHASKSTNTTGSWSEVYWGKDYYMLVGLSMRQVHGARDIWKGIITCQSVYQCDKSMVLGIFGKGLLYASQSINATGPWSEGYKKGLLHTSYSTYATRTWSQGHKNRDYYMLFSLPIRQVLYSTLPYYANSIVVVSISEV